MTGIVVPIIGPGGGRRPVNREAARSEKGFSMRSEVKGRVPGRFGERKAPGAFTITPMSRGADPLALMNPLANKSVHEPLVQDTQASMSKKESPRATMGIESDDSLAVG